MPAPSRTLVIGDIHGAARALDQALDRARFDPAADRLISLGDVCDRGPEVDRCIDRLLALDHVLLVRGNHDDWALDWLRTGEADQWWLGNGGDGTVAAYARRAGVAVPRRPAGVVELSRTVPADHIAFLEAGADYHIETRPDGRHALFTHAGWDPRQPPGRQSEEDLRWSRGFWSEVRARAATRADPAAGAGDDATVTGYDVVFIGHTPTLADWTDPRPLLEVWNLDQGAGWGGPLTVMDADTHEWWQSDPVAELYPAG